MVPLCCFFLLFIVGKYYLFFAQIKKRTPIVVTTIKVGLNTFLTKAKTRVIKILFIPHFAHLGPKII